MAQIKDWLETGQSITAEEWLQITDPKTYQRRSAVPADYDTSAVSDNNLMPPIDPNPSVFELELQKSAVPTTLQNQNKVELELQNKFQNKSTANFNPTIIIFDWV